MNHEINESHCFPGALQSDAHGAWYERPAALGRPALYVTLRAKRYMTERDHKWVEKGQFTIEELHPLVRQLAVLPPPDTLWLYEVESFEVDQEHHTDQETFIDHKESIKSAVFSDFDAAMDYCRRTFQLAMSDFKKRSQTNYPHY
jgi:hypothetical protein